MYVIRRNIDLDTPALAEIFLAARVRAIHWLDPESFGISDFAAKTEGETIYLAEGGDGQASVRGCCGAPMRGCRVPIT